MSLGYDLYEDNRDFQQKGLTGEVKRYTTAKMEFPCYVVCSTETNQVEMYKIQVLKQMFATSKIYNESEANSMIHLYFSQGNQVAKLGIIQPKQVKSFLKLFESNQVDGYFEDGILLQGEHLYVLAE